MATVDKESANWRLLGGGGLLVGGVLWLIGVILKLLAISAVPAYVIAVGLLLIGVALFFVALGETGSNGAVGNSLAGKLVLFAAGIGWVLYALITLLAAIGIGASSVVTTIAGILVVVGGILATVIIYQRGVARGAARWIIAVPTVIAIFWVIVSLGWVTLGPTADTVVALALSLAWAVTGLLYLLNRKDVG